MCNPSPTLKLFTSRPDLVSVLLSAEGDLHPMCISRSFPSQESRPYRFGNREGRVIAPYPSRRVGHGQVQLRDGECFPVNFGPFGPPPPQPVHDAAGHLSRWGLLITAALFLARFWCSQSRRSPGQAHLPDIGFPMETTSPGAHRPAGLWPVAVSLHHALSVDRPARGLYR